MESPMDVIQRSNGPMVLASQLVLPRRVETGSFNMEKKNGGSTWALRL